LPDAYWIFSSHPQAPSIISRGMATLTSANATVPKVPEPNKRPGVCYAVTSDGVELPVVDVTHLAFALSVTDSEQKARVEEFLRQGTPLTFLPKALREVALRLLLRESILAQGIQQARSTFMSGMHTYLLKLGPQMLGGAYTKPIDRQIASALPSFCVRLRLQDMAQLMADTLLPQLRSNPGRSLRFINIAGGPAMDSLNALILLNRNEPAILEHRAVAIDVLDLEDAGPFFGASALAALSQPGAPLHGLRVKLHHIPYDWTRPQELRKQFSETTANDPLTICSSEGGLFEYGSDDEIESNLKVLREQPQVLVVVGSVTRSDKPVQQLRKATTPKTRPRGLAVFAALAQHAGWKITRAIERPFSDQVVLT
jgi:hypothetical protein